MKKIELESVLIDILGRPNVACRRPIYDKYDKNVQGNTAHERGKTTTSVITPFKDFPELGETEGDIGVTVGTGGNPYRAEIGPRIAAEYAICEAALKVACVGGEWLGATDCLNFGNPEKEVQMAELVEGMEGVKMACETLGIPIVSGNVSLYNESSGNSIPPSALVSVFGRVDDIEAAKPSYLQSSGKKIWYLGLGLSLVASEFFNLAEVEDTNILPIDYADFEALVEDIKSNLESFETIQAVGPGGVWATLIAAAAEKNIGFSLDLASDPINTLLGEGLGVIVVTEKDLSGLDGAKLIGETASGSQVVVCSEEKIILSSNLGQLLESWKKELSHIF